MIFFKKKSFESFEDSEMILKKNKKESHALGLVHNSSR